MGVKNQSSDNDDEISIDFSKITNFFKGKKKKQEDKKEDKKFDKTDLKEDKHQQHKSKDTKTESSSDDDVSIDFSGIKNWFKSKKHSKSSNEDKNEKTQKVDSKKEKSDEDSDEVEINSESMKKFTDFISKYGVYFLILIPIFLTIFVRAQTINLTITEDWAKSSVENYYKNQIATQIKSQNPNLPDANFQQLVEQNYVDFAKQNTVQMQQQVDAISTQYKQYFSYQSGTHTYTYMGDIDSYYFLRMARNLDEKGRLCDVMENGKCYDTYTLAPLRLEQPKTLHPYSIYYTYKILKPFNPDLTLMQAQLMVPTIYAVILAALVFIMMLKSFGPLAALTSSILISVNPIFLTRSLGSDTDIYNIFFPVLVIFFAFEAFTNQSWKKKSIYASLAGLSMGAYSFAWIGWWYLFYFIILGLLVDYFVFVLREHRISKSQSKKFDLNKLIKNKRSIDLIAVLIPVIFFTFLSVWIIIGISPLSQVIGGPLGFITTKVASNPNLWPNVLTTVAEFNSSSLGQIIGQMGGKWIFFLAMTGFILVIFGNYKRVKKNIVLFLLALSIIYYLVGTTSGTSLGPMAYLILFFIPFILGSYLAYKSDEDLDLKLAVMFFLWGAASIYAALKGVRFSLLLVPPIGIGVGISLGFLYDSILKIFEKAFDVKHFIVSFIVFLVLAYPLVNQVQGGFATAKSYIPNVNDQWYDALTKIKEDSKPDAIINSWWDFGHWFKYFADRRVTLDGSSQNSPQLHWLGKALLTSDENEARGILQMLDCGGNNAFDAINNKLKDIPKSINLLNKMLLVDKSSAKKILNDASFSNDESENVLQYSHCNAPENYFITSEDMVGKGGVWAHFGSWDFDKSYMHSTYDGTGSESKAIQQIMAEFNLSKEVSTQYVKEIRNLKTDNDVNAWIAPWPSYMQSETPCLPKSNSTVVVCTIQQLPVEINTTDMDTFINTPQGVKRPNNIVYTTSTGIAKKSYDQDLAGFGIVLQITQDGYTSLFMAPELTDSMFTRLFFLDGHGIKYFDLFHSSEGMNNFKLSVWKVNWQGNDKAIIVPKYQIIQTNNTSTSIVQTNSSSANSSIETTTIIDLTQNETNITLV